MEKQNTPKPEIDISTLRYNISLSPTQRLEQHHFSLEVVLELEKAHKNIYAKLKSTSKNTSKR